MGYGEIYKLMPSVLSIEGRDRGDISTRSLFVAVLCYEGGVWCVVCVVLAAILCYEGGVWCVVCVVLAAMLCYEGGVWCVVYGVVWCVWCV